jgi:hypothetical protein
VSGLRDPGNDHFLSEKSGKKISVGNQTYSKILLLPKICIALRLMRKATCIENASGF